MVRRLVVGDIHGCFDKLQDVLNKAEFNADEDILYGLGDLCDRGNQNKEVLDYLSSLPHFQAVFGNHDIWLKEYIQCLVEDKKIHFEVADIWRNNGGSNTIRALKDCSKKDLEKYLKFIGGFKYRITLEDAIIIHNPIFPDYMPFNDEAFLDKINLGNCIEKDLIRDGVYDEVIWGRSVAFLPYPTPDNYITRYNPDKSKLTIYGHTPYEEVTYNPDLNILGIDTASFVGIAHPASAYGWPHDGRITVYDISSKKYWQSGVEGEFTLSTSP